jgi:hypothetical protein
MQGLGKVQWQMVWDAAVAAVQQTGVQPQVGVMVSSSCWCKGQVVLTNL